MFGTRAQRRARRRHPLGDARAGVLRRARAGRGARHGGDLRRRRPARRQRRHHDRHARRAGRAGHSGLRAAHRVDERAGRPDDLDGQRSSGCSRCSTHPSRSPTAPVRSTSSSRPGGSSSSDVTFRYPPAPQSSIASMEATHDRRRRSRPRRADRREPRRSSRARRWRWSVRPAPARRRSMSLIPRLYDVTSGAVLVDGHDVRDLTLASLRGAIGVVAQDPHLFHEIDRRRTCATPSRTRRRRRAGRGVPGGAHPRHDRGAARRLRHRGRRARLPAVGRREAAPGDRPPAAQGPGDHDPRRGDEPPRQRQRVARAGGARGGAARAAPRS